MEAPRRGDVIQRARNLVEWGRWKEAREMIAAAVAQPQNATNAQLLAYYAHLLVKFGEVGQAAKLAHKAVSLDKSCASCHLYLFEAKAEHAKTLSRFRALLELPGLKKQLETATKLDPDMADVQWAWIEFDLELPNALGGSSTDARKHADKLAAIDPVDGNLARAHVAKAENKPTEALADYRAAVAANPQDPRGVFALGRELYNRGEYEAAAPYLSRALALNQQSALYCAYQAANLVHLKQLVEARNVIQRGAALHPESRYCEYMAAQAFKSVGQDYAWAKQLLESYLKVKPEPEQPSLADARNLLASLNSPAV